MTQKGIKELAPFAIALISLVATVVVGSVTVAEMQDSAYLDTSIENETFNATDDSYTYTVEEASSSDFVDLQRITVYDTTSQSTELDAEIVDAEAGEIEVNGSVDEEDESIDYTYSQESQANGILDQGASALSTFSDFFVVIVVVGIAAVIFLLLGALRRAGGRTMA